MSKVLVLLSGGLDSTTLATYCCKQYGAENVHGLFVSYGQMHCEREEGSSQLVADDLGLESWSRLVIPFDFLSLESSGLTGEAVIPDEDYSEIVGLSPSYVPFRNGTLISLAAARALQIGADIIALGVHADDAENWAYPDCTPEFVGAMSNAVYVGSYFKVRVIAPLVYMSKADIVRMASRLGAPLHLSWSCYHAGELQCGGCPTCRSRKDAFKIAEVVDPTVYET